MTSEITIFPTDIYDRIRLLAAELQYRKTSVQLREIHTTAGRLAEQSRCAGAKRWESVRFQDEFVELCLARLRELKGQPREKTGTLLAFAGGSR